jgi:acylphosphatase
VKEPKETETVRIHICVRGRVQGVGFRAFAQQAGTVLGLTGWVRNVGYDKVETVAEGPREKLEKFADAIKKGPRAGNVQETKVEWETAQGDIKGFNVKYNVE